MYDFGDQHFPSAIEQKISDIEHQIGLCIKVLESVPQEKRELNHERAMFECLKGRFYNAIPDVYKEEAECHLLKAIINWRSCLKFPEEPKVSDAAKDLICRLLCDVESRLGTRGVEEIKAHPWFEGTKWDALYEMKAAYKPIVTGELDTQNFEKFTKI